jgi:hypothetical protein
MPLSRPNALIDLVNRRSFQLGSLLLWALLMNREGVRVPNGNEFVYLLYFYKAWHPHFLSADWTFQEATAGHAIFNWTTGWLTLLMPLEWAAWLGRFCVWTGAFVGLMRVGSHFKIPSWAVWMGIILWLVQRQAPVTVEWIVGTFEAKCIAYIFLLFAMDAALRSRNLLAGLLCGLAFTFHTAIGMWGGTALGVAVLFHNPLRETIKFCIAAMLLALPGLITSLPLVFGKHAITPAEAKFIVEVFEPSCLDPLIFPRLWLILMPVLMVFAWGYFQWQRSDRSARMLFYFELFTAVFFLFSVLARIADRFDLVQLYPLRVFSVFVLLLFYWQMARICLSFFKPYAATNRRQAPVMLFWFGIVLLLVIPNPLTQLGSMLTTHLHRIQEISGNQPSPGRSEDASFRDAAKWVQQNTPVDDIVMAPPWRSDAFYFTRRPLIAEWHAPRYDAITQWRSRIEAMAGDVSINNDCPGDMGTQQRLHFTQLSQSQVLEIAGKYGAKWIITHARYSLPQVYDAGEFVVYRIE